MAAVLLAFSSFAVAQSWPSRTITLIVSQTPGTAPDFVGRTIEASGGTAARMAEILQFELDRWRKIAEVAGITAD